MFSSAGVSATFQEEIKHPPEEQQTFVESRLFIGDEAIALGSCALNEIVLRFWDFFLCRWVATSCSRKHLMGRFWLPPTAVWRTRRPHTPHQEHPAISLAVVVACEEL